MERKPWIQKLASLFGAKEPVAHQHALSAPENVRAFGLGKYSDFRSFKMRRGVQESMERAQRPARLAWIYESCKQARELRCAFRNAQIIKRQIRAELRAA